MKIMGRAGVLFAVSLIVVTNTICMFLSHSAEKNNPFHSYLFLNPQQKPAVHIFHSPHEHGSSVLAVKNNPDNAPESGETLIISVHGFDSLYMTAVGSMFFEADFGNSLPLSSEYISSSQAIEPQPLSPLGLIYRVEKPPIFSSRPSQTG